MKTILTTLAISAVSLFGVITARGQWLISYPTLNLLEFNLTTNLITVGQPIALTVRWEDTNPPALPPWWPHDYVTQIQWGDGGYQVLQTGNQPSIYHISHTYARPLDPFFINVYTIDFARSTYPMGYHFRYVSVIPTNTILTAPVFTAKSVQTNGPAPGVHLSLAGDPGRIYRIQATTNYTDWFTVVQQAVADGNGDINATDPNPDGAIRLYRAVFP